MAEEQPVAVGLPALTEAAAGTVFLRQRTT